MSRRPHDQAPDERILIELEVPAESSLNREAALRLARESFYVELYRLGLIGSGRASAPLSMDRSAFLDVVSAHGVSWWDEALDVGQEGRNALPFREGS